MPPNHLILCRPLLLLPSILHSIRVFPNESVLCIRWSKYFNNFKKLLNNKTNQRDPVSISEFPFPCCQLFSWIESLHFDWENLNIYLLSCINGASLVAQMVKDPHAMQETWVRSLGREDLLEEGMATHSSILAWSFPVDRGEWQAIVHGVAKSWTRQND